MTVLCRSGQSLCQRRLRERAVQLCLRRTWSSGSQKVSMRQQTQTCSLSRQSISSLTKHSGRRVKALRMQWLHILC